MWTVSGRGYVGKPRTAVIIQDEAFDTDSVTVCPLTTDPADLPLFRLRITPTGANGLDKDCAVMTDNVLTVPRSKVGTRLGHLSTRDMMRVDRALALFLGLAS